MSVHISDLPSRTRPNGLWKVYYLKDGESQKAKERKIRQQRRREWPNGSTEKKRRKALKTARKRILEQNERGGSNWGGGNARGGTRAGVGRAPERPLTSLQRGETTVIPAKDTSKSDPVWSGREVGSIDHEERGVRLGGKTKKVLPRVGRDKKTKASKTASRQRRVEVPIRSAGGAGSRPYLRMSGRRFWREGKESPEHLSLLAKGEENI